MKETRKVAQATQVINEVEQVKLYRLLLNPLHLNKKHKIIVAIGYEKEKLIEFYNSQISETPDSGHYFNDDGPLKWFNPSEDETTFEVKDNSPGIDSIWTDDKMIQKFLLESPEVPLLPADSTIPLAENTEGLKIV